MKYWILKHNGLYSWDLVQSVKGRRKAVAVLNKLMRKDPTAQYIVRYKGYPPEDE